MYLRSVISALPTKDRLLNRKHAQQLRFIVHWYDVRHQFLRSEFDPHGGWWFLLFYTSLFTTNNIKLTFGQYPVIHTNYSLSNCTNLQYNHDI